MMHEGVILEIKKHYLIVLSQEGDYVKLKYKKGSYEGQRIYYTGEDIFQRSKYKRVYVAAALILLVVLPTFAFISLPSNVDTVYAAAVIDVDINPSMALMIDGQGVLIDIDPLNEDAKHFIRSDWIGKLYSQVITDLLKEADKAGYLKEDSIVMISCTVLDDQISSEGIESDTEEAILNYEKELSYTYLLAGEQQLEEARKEELSVGKYKLYQEIRKIHPDIDPQELQGKALSDLIHETKNIKIYKKEKEQKQKNSQKETKNQTQIENNEKQSMHNQSHFKNENKVEKNQKNNDINEKEGNNQNSKRNTDKRNENKLDNNKNIEFIQEKLNNQTDENKAVENRKNNGQRTEKKGSNKSKSYKDKKKSKKDTNANNKK